VKLLEPAASRLPPERVDRFECEAICLRVTVGGRQAEQGSRESMEEDDMVMRVGSSLEGRDEPMRRTRGLQAQGSL